MPFGIKLRRTGRYILSHKNSFLVRVQLLDNTVMECTLTVENTGYDCLHAVANKLDLKEVQYFGLRYLNKRMAMRLVELDKPLKKQIDKYAQDPTLHFGVVFYVTIPELLQQEITRYLFYLQLKNNVIDGLLPTTSNEAIELASYMIQAEFGDHTPDIHTVQYFHDFILFPEAVAPTEEILDSLTQNTLTLHKKHRELSASDAEYNYVLKVIHLDGYGEEMYPAKDCLNGSYEIGCSFVGIAIRQTVTMPFPKSSAHDGLSQPQQSEVHDGIVWYEWSSVDHVACSKSLLMLNLKKDDASHQFHMEDADAAKYVCRMFEQKRKFYSTGGQNHRKLPTENSESAIQRRPTLRRTQDAPLPDSEIHGNTSSEQNPDMVQQRKADYLSSEENLNGTYNNQQETQYYASQTSLDHTYVSQTSLNHVPSMPQDYGYANGYALGGSMYSSPSVSSLVQSQTRLGRQSPSSSNMSLHSSDRHQPGGGIPMYRCTPDYEQAVRQRRRYSSYLENHAMAQQHAMNNPAAAVPDASKKPRPHSMIYSPQELLQQAIQGPHYAQYPLQNPPLCYHSAAQQSVESASRLPSSQTPLHRQFDASHESLPTVHLLPQHQMQALQYSHQGICVAHLNDVHLLGSGPGNTILAASTPELTNTMQQVKGYSSSEMQLLRYYTKPPPPYPPNNSTSTPDLSMHRPSTVSASSPDLHDIDGHVQTQRQLFARAAVAESGYAMAQRQSVSHQVGQDEDYLTSEALSVILRGVCTGVEATHQNIVEESSYKNQKEQQHDQTSEQSVQAYLQHLAIEQSPEPTRQFRMRPGQHPPQKHHRPVSYPPQLNQSHQFSVMEEQRELPRRKAGLPFIPQDMIAAQSHQSFSSTSTVESVYGSQQYMHEGSLISLHSSQLAPASHPIVVDGPTPQRSDTFNNMSRSSEDVQCGHQLTQLNQLPSLVQADRFIGRKEEHYQHAAAPYVSTELDGVPDKYEIVPQHSQMPSNATMLIHSSASERGSEDESSVSSDEGQIWNCHVDYRQIPLTTIDHWHRKRPTEMYVPPKPKPNGQLSEEWLPPIYPEDSNDNDRKPDCNTDFNPRTMPKIPNIATEDHDPPRSYRKLMEMKSYDEADMTTVSVFPHPNPSMPHSGKLSETNPIFLPSLSKNNPFYYPEKATTRDRGDINQVITESEEEAKVLREKSDNTDELNLDSLSEVLPHTHRSSVRNELQKNELIDRCNAEPPSAGMPDERVYQLEKQLENGQVLTEYEKIPRKRTMAAIACGNSVGLRDRVKSIVPYFDNGIRLEASSTNPDGYINASFVQMNVADQQWNYIMCQNPLEEFLDEFWEMVWDQHVCVIVMMSREIEDGRVKCGRYWPEHTGDSNAMLYGDYRVSYEVVSEASKSHGAEHSPVSEAYECTCDNLVTSRIVLRRAGTAECRKLWHLRYVGWPDKGAPEQAEDFLSLMEELESVRRLADGEESQFGSPPVIVHCASGAGRSGVLILCDLMRHSLERNEATTVPGMLKALRDQRMDSIQTVSQYNFVYQVLIRFLKNSRLI